MVTVGTTAGLVGRKQELALIGDVLRAMRAGRGGAVLFSGEPGSGKTSLLDAATGRAAEALVLSCRGVEWEAELPFSGLHELLGPLLGDLEPLPEPQRAALEAAFGVTSTAVPSLHLYAGALSLLLEATRARPVLLLVDDLQWLDAPTAQAVSFIARRMPGERLGLIAATRPGTELPGLARPAVGVHPLDRNAVRLVAEREFGRPLPASVIDDLTGASGGNPLAVVESLRTLGGDLTRRGTLLDDPLPVGELIERGFAQRLDALTPEARATAELAAASVSELTSVLVDAMAAAGQPDSSLDELEIAGVVEVGSGRVLFAHPLLRALVHRRSSAVDLRRWHAALAEVTQERALRAWHLATATRGPDAEVADELDAVAEDFILRGGGLAAAQALTRAAALTPDGDTRGDRLARAARAAHTAGRPEWSGVLYTEALECISDEETRVRAKYGKVLLEGNTGADLELASRFIELANEAEVTSPQTTATALCSAAAEYCVGGLSANGAADVVERLRRFEGSPDLDAEVRNDVLWTLALLEILQGLETAKTRAALEAAARERLVMYIPDAPLMVEALVWTEGFETARVLLEVALRQSEVRGDVFLTVGQWWSEALLCSCVGDWNSALHTLARGLTIASSFASLESALLLLRGWIRAARGEASGIDDLERAALVGVRDGRGVSEQWRVNGRGLFALAHRRIADAVAEFEREAAWIAKAGFKQPPIGTGPVDLAEAYARAGRRPDAEAALDAVRDYHARTGRLWAAAGIAHVEGLLATDEAFDARFEQAVAGARTAQHPFLEARSQLAWGERLVFVGRRDDAQRPLRVAVEIFGRLGADAWVEQARTELGVEPEAQAVVAAADLLTPQERQVAELVAAGASNKDAAGELFLSPKTIEAHLSRIYRKLGVGSRTQLAAQFAQTGATGDDR